MVAATTLPALAHKRVSLHPIRPTTAMHLRWAGVDIGTIRVWLGHVSLNTMNVYAEIALEMTANALANCAVEEETPQLPWRDNQELMEFLRTL